MKYCIQYVCCLNTCMTSPHGWSLSDCNGTVCLELLLQDAQKGSRLVRYLISSSSRALLHIAIKSLHYICTHTIYKTHTVQTHQIIRICFCSISLNTHCNYQYTGYTIKYITKFIYSYYIEYILQCSCHHV